MHRGSAVRPSEALGEAGRFDRMLAVRARALRRTAAASGTPCRDCRGRADRTPRARAASAPRSSGVNIVGMYCDLSAPMPCSPVSEPPASMQYDRISAATSTGLRPPGPGSARRSRSADAGCRRRRGTRCRCAGPIAASSCADAVQHLGQLACAARRRPARSSSARRGPSPRTPPCGPRQIRARCSSVCATSIVVAPCRRHICTTIVEQRA